MEFITDVINFIVSIMTLGIYNDISNLIEPTSNPSSSAIAYAITIARVVFAGVTTFVILRKLCDRFKLNERIVIFGTVAMVIVYIAITQPWVVAEDLSNRIGGFTEALSDYDVVEYSPTLLNTFPVNVFMDVVYNGVDSLDGVFSWMRNKTSFSVSLPDVGRNGVTSTDVSFDWLYFLIVIALVLIVFYILKHFNKVLAVIAVVTIISLGLGISANLIITLILVGFMVYLSVMLVKKGRYIVSIYPVLFSALLVLSLIQIPKSMLIILLLVLMYLALIPAFYLVGLAIAGVGEVLEQREKFGMKVKPKKVIEESVGEWDELAVSVVLSGIFMLSIALYGTTLLGLITFIAISTLILK